VLNAKVLVAKCNNVHALASDVSPGQLYTSYPLYISGESGHLTGQGNNFPALHNDGCFVLQLHIAQDFNKQASHAASMHTPSIVLKHEAKNWQTYCISV